MASIDYQVSYNFDLRATGSDGNGGVNANVSDKGWLGFLDALGQLEGEQGYASINDEDPPYIGIYQFASFEANKPLFETIKFAETIGLALNVSSDSEFFENPIAQEISAIMEFSGIPDLNDDPEYRFASKFTAVRNAKGFLSKTQFDSLIGKTITVNHVDDSGNSIQIIDGGEQKNYTQEITLNVAGISAAAHLVGEKGVAEGLYDIYHQIFDDNGVLVSTEVNLVNDSNFADGNRVSFTTYMNALDEYDLSNLRTKVDGAAYDFFNARVEELLNYRKDKILQYIQDNNLEIKLDPVITLDSGEESSAYLGTVEAILRGLGQYYGDDIESISGSVILVSGNTAKQTEDGDLIIGLGEDDVLFGGHGEDEIYGGEGRDFIYAQNNLEFS